MARWSNKAGRSVETYAHIYQGAREQLRGRPARTFNTHNRSTALSLGATKRSAVSAVWHLAVLLSGVCALAPASVAAQGIRYHLRPAATWTEWDGALGLENGRFLGGMAGIGFGRYVDLTGFYLRSDNRWTNLSSIPFAAEEGKPLTDQSVDIVSYGSELSIGLASGSLVPLLMGGGGILRFRPAAGEEIQRIQLKYGLGFRTLLTDALEAEVMLERNRYYLDSLDRARPVSEGDPAFSEDPDADALRRNLAVRVGLGLRLEGVDYNQVRDLDRTGMHTGSRLSLEPFGGLQTFDAGLGINHQSIAGFRAGFDLGPFLGLRGFWWRGVNDDFDAWEGVEGYGGEAQFKLSSDAEVSPHLLAGGGKMVFAPDFSEGGADVSADRKALILGGGLDLRFGPRLLLSATARDYIVAGSGFGDTPPDLQDVQDPRQLAHNWQMSVGLKILVGGDTRPSRAEAARRGAVAAPMTRGEAVPAGDKQTEQTRLQAGTQAGLVPEQMVIRVPGSDEPLIVSNSVATPPIIVIPVGIPAYDLPDGAEDTPATAGADVMTLADFRDLLRAEIARVTASNNPATASSGTGVSQADLKAVETRLAELLKSRLDDIQRRLDEIARTGAETRLKSRLDDMQRRLDEIARTKAAADTLPDEPNAGVEASVFGRTGLDSSLGFPSQELRPYTAIQFSRHWQWVFGFAWDRGPSDILDAFNIVPEVALGLGQGKPTYMASGNLQYRFPWVFERDSFWISPVASFGLGLLKQDGTGLVLNASYGIHVQLRRDHWDGVPPVNLYVAHQGVGLFRRDRLIVGLSLER